MHVQPRAARVYALIGALTSSDGAPGRRRVWETITAKPLRRQDDQVNYWRHPEKARSRGLKSRCPLARARAAPVVIRFTPFRCDLTARNSAPCSWRHPRERCPIAPSGVGFRIMTVDRGQVVMIQRDPDHRRIQPARPFISRSSRWRCCRSRTECAPTPGRQHPRHGGIFPGGPSRRVVIAGLFTSGPADSWQASRSGTERR